MEGKSQFVAAASALLATLDNEVAKIAYAQQIAYELQVPELSLIHIYYGTFCSIGSI